jgi:hypothetical protein
LSLSGKRLRPRGTADQRGTTEVTARHIHRELVEYTTLSFAERILAEAVVEAEKAAPGVHATAALVGGAAARWRG